MPALAPTDQGLRGHLDRVFQELWSEKEEGFDSIWRELASYLAPSRPRHYTTSSSNSQKIGAGSARIYDGTATLSVRVGQAGMLSGTASPARPWFGLSAIGPSGKKPAVKRWMEAAQEELLAVFDRSNVYTSLGAMFGDEMSYGTSPMLVFEDAKTVIRCQGLPVGSFAIAQDRMGRVDTIVRTFQMTVRQIVDEWGLEALTPRMASEYNSRRLHTKFSVNHAILPNPNAIEGSPLAVHLPWAEFYWEGRSPTDQYGSGRQVTPVGPHTTGGGAYGGRTDGIIYVGGYHEFPAVVARWGRTDDDTYASQYPGIDALGDIKQLQEMVRVSTNALNKMVDPTLVGGPGVKGRAVSLLPGAVNIDPDMTGGQNRLGAMYEVRYPVREANEVIEQVRSRIRDFFYERQFLMLSGERGDLTPLTAAETVAREREKLAVLGPVFERHADDVFDPLISRTLSVMIRMSEPEWAVGRDGILPRPPQELEGVELKPIYVSEVAKAQKLVGLASIERHAQFLGGVAQLYPEALDVPDIDEIIRYHAEIAGVPSKLIRLPEQTSQARQQRAKAAQQQAMMENAPGVARAAKDLADTDASAAKDSARELMGAGA